MYFLVSGIEQCRWLGEGEAAQGLADERELIVKYVQSHELESGGYGCYPRKEGEAGIGHVTMTYCALNVLRIMGAPPSSNVDATRSFLKKLQDNQGRIMSSILYPEENDLRYRNNRSFNALFHTDSCIRPVHLLP